MAGRAPARPCAGRARRCHDRTAGVVNRLQEAAGVGVPAGLGPARPRPRAGDGSPAAPWAAGARPAIGDQRLESTLDDELTAASEQLEPARAACERGRQRGPGTRPRERAQQSLDELARPPTSSTTLVESVEAHRRAASVLPAACGRGRRRGRSRCAEPLPRTHARAAGRASCSAGCRSRGATGRAGRGRDSGRARPAPSPSPGCPASSELHDERARLTSLSAAAVAAGAQVSRRRRGRARRARGHADARLVAAAGPRRAARGAAARMPRDLGRGRRGRSGAPPEEASLADGPARRGRGLGSHEATEHAQDLRELHLDLRERRISGMAAELAGRSRRRAAPARSAAAPSTPSPATASGRVSRADEEARAQAHETPTSSARPSRSR